MRKLFVGTRAGVVAVVLAATVAVAGPASGCSGPPRRSSSTTAPWPTRPGPIFTTLPEGSYLSLGQVVKLHTTNPDLFAWCR